MANHRVMSLPLESENVEETFNPLDYVVDAKGNRWSGNPVSEVETVEGVCEAASIVTHTQVNYIQVQTPLAARSMGKP